MTKISMNRRRALAMLGSATILPLMDAFPVKAAVPGTLIIATPYSAKSLFPAVDQSSANKAMCANIFEKLVNYDIDYNIIPSLAESFERSADGKSVTFKLRKNAKWHDGTPFTSADVKWFFEKMVPNFESRAKTVWKQIGFKAVDTPDDYTAICVAEKAPWDLSWFITLPYVSTIMPRHKLEGLTREQMQTHEFNTKPIGTGPWKVQSFAPGETLIFSANEDYYTGAPKIAKLILRTITQPQSAMLAYQAGEVDGLHEWYANIGLAPQLEKIKALPNTEVIGYAYYNLIRFIFNYRPEAVAKYPWLKDLNVRKAFAHAIDKETLVKRAFGGAGVPVADGLFTLTNKQFFNADVAKYPYDPKLAAQLFDAAGLKADSSGVRMTLPLPYTSGETPDVVIQVVAQMLRQVGVVLTPQPMESGAYSSTYWLSPGGWKDVPVTIFSLTPGPAPDGLANIYHSAFTPDKGGRNASFYANPEVDKLLDAALVEGDLTKQTKLYKDVQAILMDDLVAVPLYQSYLAQVWNTRIGHDPQVSRPTHFFTPYYQVWEKRA